MIQHLWGLFPDYNRFIFELIYEYFLSENLDILYDIFRIFFFFSFSGFSFKMYF